MSEPPAFASRIEDYALIGDCTTAALVGRNGSIDWLCWPHFDSAACFAALLGTPDHGRWLIAPADPPARVQRSYRDGSLVLETVFTTDEGEVALTDFMPVDARGSSVVRVVEGRSGRVRMTMELLLRFDFGATIPWVTRLAGGQAVRAIAGPNLVVFRADVPLVGRGLTTVSDFTVGEGERVRFTLSHGPSHEDIPFALDVASALDSTERFWTDWSGRCTYQGEWPEAVRRSLVGPEGADLPLDGGHGSRTNYLASGGIGRHPQLGLPLLLAQGRDDYALRHAPLRLYGRGIRLAGLAAPEHRWQPGSGAAAVWIARRTAA